MFLSVRPTLLSVMTVTHLFVNNWVCFYFPLRHEMYTFATLRQPTCHPDTGLGSLQHFTATRSMHMNHFNGCDLVMCWSCDPIPQPHTLQATSRFTYPLILSLLIINALANPINTRGFMITFTKFLSCFGNSQYPLGSFSFHTSMARVFACARG